jgi:hypothetical protein
MATRSRLYFDTEQFDVFHRRGSVWPGKYRIRPTAKSGGVPGT